MKITKKLFGNYKGKDIVLFCLENDNNVSVHVMNYGATLVKFLVPNKHNDIKNIVLGFDNFDDYIRPDNDTYFGATIGRNSGRIKNGVSKIQGTKYQFNINDNGNTLHGGKDSFNTKVWSYNTCQSVDKLSVTFNLQSPDGENGFPGNLDVGVTYTLNSSNELIISYTGKTDQPTIYTPTNHSYFNLNGDPKKTILNHYLKLTSDYIAEINDTLLPNGNFLDVTGTPFDFRQETLIENSLKKEHKQTLLTKGFDHPFLLNDNEKVICLTEKNNGYRLTVTTTEPSVVIYTSNMMHGQVAINDHALTPYSGITLETQALPDTPNQKNFGSWLLEPGNLYSSQTIYKIETI